MSDEQHTPGEWVLEPTKSLPHFWIIKSVDENGDLLSDIAYISLARSESNARLMCAAPKMLAALKDILETEVDCNHIKHGHRYMNARYAIAKAEGRA